MYQKWPSKPSILSRVSPGHLYYLFLDITPAYFQKYFAKRRKLENRKSQNMKMQKPRFTNRSPAFWVPPGITKPRIILRAMWVVLVTRCLFPKIGRHKLIIKLFLSVLILFSAKTQRIDSYTICEPFGRIVFPFAKTMR